MTGLADAYSNDVGALQSSRRLWAGIGLLVLGTLLGLAALVVALVNPTEWGSRRLAGALAGLAAPAMAGGVVVILPASRRLRAAAAIGASLTVLGVASFWHAYPSHWLGHGRELTPYVTLVYFLGVLTILVCLFAGIATFKRRNDPGGTVSLTVGERETEVVHVREDGGGFGGFGGIGLLGGTPEGDVETQTNRPDGTGAGAAGAGTTRSSSGLGPSSSGGQSTSSGGQSTSSTVQSTSGGRSNRAARLGSSSGSAGGLSGAASTVSDGGSEPETLQSPEPKGEPSSPSVADRYCGNCEHFQYVRTEQGMTPYCELTAEHMDDVEACEDWSPNA